MKLNSKEEELLGIIRIWGRLKTVDIVKNAEMCKVTALKYLNGLKRSGYVDYELIGPTKLWYAVDKDGLGVPENKSDVDISEVLKRFESITGKKSVVIMPVEDLVSIFKRMS